MNAAFTTKTLQALSQTFIVISLIHILAVSDKDVNADLEGDPEGPERDNAGINRAVTQDRWCVNPR